MDLTTILDDGLERLARGESRAEVLARYPDAASELAPALDAAVALQALAGQRLTDAQRLRAKVTLRETLAARRPAPGAFWGRLRLLPSALLLAFLLIGAASFSAVAFSQPGDVAYPIRVAVERAPALVKFTPESQADAELDAADRRLDDLEHHLATFGWAHPVALEALLEGEAVAARRGIGRSARGARPSGPAFDPTCRGTDRTCRDFDGHPGRRDAAHGSGTRTRIGQRHASRAQAVGAGHADGCPLSQWGRHSARTAG